MLDRLYKVWVSKQVMRTELIVSMEAFETIYMPVRV
jgi:hypothetical protein